MATAVKTEILLPSLELDVAAMTYFVEYLMTDRPCIDSLSNGASPGLKALELEFIANTYLVSRTLPKNSEDGSVRLLRALELLLKQPRPSEASAVDLVANFATELGKLYPFKDGVREPISTASKFLWMYFQSPIVIYDALAATWIRTTHKTKELNYAGYFAFWRKSYADNREQVEKACSALRLSPIAQSISMSHNIELTELSEKQWFLERVFDHAIVRSASQHGAEFERAKRSASLQ